MTTLGTFIYKERSKRNLSTRQLSQLTGVSHTEIFRIEKGDRMNPSPIILRDIALSLEISYAEIISRAGYPNPEDIEAQILSLKRRNLDEIFIKSLTPMLLHNSWSVTQNNNSKTDFDLVATKQNQKWGFNYTFTTSTSPHVLSRTHYQTYGLLSTFDLSNFSKISIVINNKFLMDLFKKNPPRNFDISISVILIDENNFSIIEESPIN